MNNEKPRPHLSSGIAVRAPWADHLVAVVVRGRTMGQIEDGWRLYYQDLKRPANDSLIGKLCVVKTEEYGVIVRYVHKGRKRGRFDLVSISGTPILDCAPVWAERVRLIEPYEISEDEAEQLDHLGEAESA